ncbi:MAG: T9SS type A sorting domain-containing protein [Ignavibacteriaceae bacterium]|nr:T9SS type A sorting domain-containing protein [Ignavibacteriaceae bacterium]
MKNATLVFVIILITSFTVLAQPYNVDFKVTIPTDCNGGDDVVLFSSSGKEGVEFLIPELTLPPLLSLFQDFYDIFGGGSVGLEEGTLKENIELRVNLEPIKCSPESLDIVEIIRMSIQVIGEQSGPHPIFSYYEFNEGKRAYIKLNAPELFDLFQFLGYSLDDIVAWFYAEGYTPDVTGISYEYNPDNPEWFYIYINHFSKIALGSFKNPTGIKQVGKLPTDYSLEQNFPNPFNPETKITYTLPVEGFVQLSIYNIEGEQIKSLVQEKQPAGNYTVEFDAADLSSGTYFYKIQVNDFIKIKKMLLVK